MRVPLVYKPKPVFGLDIGYNSVKLVQLRPGKHPSVLAYGHADFPPDAIIEGIVADPQELAKHIQSAISSPIAGHFTAQRVCISLPLAKVFIRTLELPTMGEQDLQQAVRLEAEQYVPVPIADLYLDYEIIETKTAKDGQTHVDVLMVAAPRAIVDSYIRLFDLLNLEVDIVEPSIRSISRAIIHGGQAAETVMIMDFNSRSSDLAIVNKTLRLTGTVAVGGEDLTKVLVEKLGISADQAKEIKFKFGVGPSGLQPKVVAALEPKLSIVTSEIKKVVKYYQERSENQEKISALILTGGGAGMPGLLDYLNKDLKLPTRIGSPWDNLNVGRLQPPSKFEAAMYATAIGLALVAGGNHD